MPHLSRSLRGVGHRAGTIDFTVAPNLLGTSRSTTISVAGQTLTVTQSGVSGGPVFSLDRATLNFAAISTGIAFASRTGSPGRAHDAERHGSVNWTATSNAPWLTVSPASGIGPAALKVGVKFTPGAPHYVSGGAITMASTAGQARFRRFPFGSV